MPERSLRIEHYTIDYDLVGHGRFWTVWELRDGLDPREVAEFTAEHTTPTCELIQLGTDAIDAAARQLRPGCRVAVGWLTGNLVAVNGEGLIQFDDGDICWYPITRVRSAE